jgi:hypothetical protein
LIYEIEESSKGKETVVERLESAFAKSSIFFFSFIIIVFFSFNFVQSDFPWQPLYTLNITLPARLNGRTINLTFDLHRTVMYADIWRGHWCPYYNDRNFFIAGRINEVLQKSRRFSVPTAFISFAAEASMHSEKQRKNAKLAIKAGNSSVIRNFKPSPSKSYHLYNPGFVDECIYKTKGKFGQYLDYNFHRQILISNDDFFVASFEEAAMLFVGLSSKQVIVIGEHSNMCLMHVLLYCEEIGITPIIVRDLTDSAYIYENQKETHSTHTSANKAVIEYIESKNWPTIKSFDLLYALKKLKGASHRPVYTRNTYTAYKFS